MAVIVLLRAVDEHSDRYIEVEGTASPTPRPLRALPIRIISMVELMLARPVRRKEREKIPPHRIIASFLPARLSKKEEHRLAKTAPRGGKETALRHWLSFIQGHTTYP